MSTVVLIDDVRRFEDGRECLVFRTSAEAISGLQGLEAVDELWLDYDLGPEDDLRPVLAYLEGRLPALAVLAVHIITSNPVGANAIKQVCDRLGWRWERHYSLRGKLTARPPDLSDPPGRIRAEGVSE